MDFQLSESEELLLASSRSFLRETATSAALLSWEGSPGGYGKEVWDELTNLGWTGIADPTSGGDLVHAGVLLDEVGRSAIALPLRECITVSAAVGRIAQGERAVSLIERICKGAVVTLLNGTGRPLPTARFEHGEVLVDSPAVVVDWAAAAESIVCAASTAYGDVCLLEVPTDRDGVIVHPVTSFDNERPAKVSLRAARAELLASSIGVDGLDELVAIASVLRIAELLGASQAVKEMTVDHVKSRVQFGHPIGSLQAVRHMCADMAMDADGMRLTTYEALWLAANGHESLHASAAAMVFGATAAERIMWTGSQLHGGVGFMTSYPLHRYFLRIKAGQLRLGTPSQINRWAAKHLLESGRDLSPFPDR